MALTLCFQIFFIYVVLEIFRPRRSIERAIDFPSAEYEANPTAFGCHQFKLEDYPKKN